MFASESCPPLLHLDAVISVHARVVGPRGQACRHEQGSDTLRGALQRDVDDRRAGRALAQALEQRLVALTCVDRRREQREVRSVETGDDGVALLDPETSADIGDDRGGRSRREREHALSPELACARRELQIVGTEVMAPLRDAVRLVDRKKRDLRLTELREEALVVEALGRDIQQLQASVAQAAGNGPHLIRGEARVEPRRLDALAREQVDLILHQRDQRRHDDRHAFEQQRGQLVAEALPRPGREDGEGGAAREQRLDDLLLARTERRVSEARGEDLGGAGHPPTVAANRHKAA